MYYPREAERDYLFTRGALLFFLILIASGLALLARSGGVLYAAINAAPVEVTGTITDVVETRKWASKADIHYAFDDASGTRGNGILSLNALVESPDYQIGDPVQVIYSDWFPSYHSLKSEFAFKRPNFYIFSGCLALIVLCLGLLWRTTKQIVQHQEEDRYY